MKKTFLIAIIITMFVLRGLAAADLLSVGDYKMYLNPAASGGDILKSDSNFRLYDAKGETLGGTLPSTPAGTTLIFGTFGLTTRMPDPVIPAGTVKLYISRGSGGNSGNIIVTWEADVYPNTKIYVRTGDGSGSYQNSYVLMGDWAKVNNSDVIGQTTVNLVDGSLTHIGQVGAGTSEVYYKALDPIGQADLTRYIPNAWAVGKFNVLINEGLNNLNSLPLVSGDPGIETIIGGQLPNGAKLSVKRPTGGWDEPIFNSNWSSNTPLDPDYGFWINSPAAVTITIVGAVSSAETRTIPVYSGLSNLLGSAYPVPVELGASGLGAALGSSGGKFSAFTGTGWDEPIYNGSTWSSQYYLRPGKGFWLNRYGAGDPTNWSYTRPY